MRRTLLAAALWISLSLPAWADPPLAKAGVVVWPLVATGSAASRVALDAQGPMLDALRNAHAFAKVDLGLPPSVRGIDQVVLAGRSYDAVMVVGGTALAIGDRVTVTVTAQDAVSGAVLSALSASGPLDQGVPLAVRLAREVAKRWLEGALQPSVVEIGAGPGVLRLDSRPQGALAELDGKPVGTTPVLLRGLSPGIHRIGAVLREPVGIDTMTLATAPPGLQVRVDDREPSFAPLTVTGLSQGGHRIVLLGETPPRQVGLHLLTTPGGATVRWDGRQLGETPLTASVRPGLGEHELNVLGRPLLGGAETVIVTSERQDRLVTLQPFAKIIVTSLPSDADVVLDDQPMGSVPLSLPVAAGRYTVRVERRTYLPEAREITVAAGEVAEVRATLRPARQGDGATVVMPTGEVVGGLAVTPFILGFGRSAEGRVVSWAGLTAGYGWPRLVDVPGFPLSLGAGISASRADGDRSAVWASGGLKLQFLEQGNDWPVSAAVGGWLQGPEPPIAQGYLALSRQIGDVTVHLGLGTGGMSINANYHRLPHWVLGGAAYLDYGALGATGAVSAPLFGLRAGYAL